jgi:hypothetical protein
MVTFWTINSESWQLNSVNLCQGLNETVFQLIKENYSFDGGLKATKAILQNHAHSICNPRSMNFLDSSGRSKFGAVECAYLNVPAFSEL